MGLGGTTTPEPLYHKGSRDCGNAESMEPRRSRLPGLDLDRVTTRLFIANTK